MSNATIILSHLFAKIISLLRYRLLNKEGCVTRQLWTSVQVKSTFTAHILLQDPSLHIETQNPPCPTIGKISAMRKIDLIQTDGWIYPSYANEILVDVPFVWMRSNPVPMSDLLKKLQHFVNGKSSEMSAEEESRFVNNEVGLPLNSSRSLVW